MKFTKEQMKTSGLTAVFVGLLAGLVYGANEGYKKFVKPRFAAKTPSDKK